MMRLYLMGLMVLTSLSLWGQLTNKEFLIEDIRNESDYQIIILSDNDTLYKVVNAQYVIPYSKCEEKIEIGKEYKLLIDKVYPTEKMRSMVYSLKISAWNGLTIEDKYHNTIYRAKNLTGLCLIPEE